MAAGRIRAWSEFYNFTIEIVFLKYFNSHVSTAKRSDMRNRFWARKWGPFPQAEYHAWHSMISRCHWQHAHNFSRYGGRGISVCDRWRDDFMSFLSDMGPRPSPAYSLDRLDNNADYAPENCRWATRYQQAHNREFVRDALGVRRAGRGWRADMGIGGGDSVTLGSFETFAEARQIYRQAALRNRIVAELSAAWARGSCAPPHAADDGALDRQLLNVLLEASRPPGYRGPRKSPPQHPGNQKAQRKPRAKRS